MKALFQILILFFIGLISITGCQPRQQWENESAQIISRLMLLDHKHEVINQQIDSLWDATTAALEKDLPENMPPVDRGIFLNARNADHIRMFASFQLLDPNTQDLINRAGEYDEILADRIHQLFEERRDIEQQRNSFLKKVAETDSKASLEYAYKFRNTTMQLSMQ